MMQGDSAYLGIEILGSGGSPVTDLDVKDLEITIGPLSKRFARGEITYAGGLWLFPLSQGESFALVPGGVDAQIRVAWANGVVEGMTLSGIRVEESISKEVL